jgi:hypothetical protein
MERASRPCLDRVGNGIDRQPDRFRRARAQRSVPLDLAIARARTRPCARARPRQRHAGSGRTSARNSSAPFMAACLHRIFVTRRGRAWLPRSCGPDRPRTRRPGRRRVRRHPAAGSMGGAPRTRRALERRGTAIWPVEGPVDGGPAATPPRHLTRIQESRGSSSFSVSGKAPVSDAHTHTHGVAPKRDAYARSTGVTATSTGQPAPRMALSAAPERWTSRLHSAPGSSASAQTSNQLRRSRGTGRDPLDGAACVLPAQRHPLDRMTSAGRWTYRS